MTKTLTPSENWKELEPYYRQKMAEARWGRIVPDELRLGISHTSNELAAEELTKDE